MRVFRLVIVATVAACAFSAPTALAQSGCDAPPGTSGIEQYCEKLPGATGDNPKPGRRGKVDPRSAAQLRRAGRDGAGVLSLTSTAPPRRGAPSKRAAPEEPSPGPAAAVGAGVESGSSVGSTFLWLLAAVAVVLGALASLRLRGRRD